jgi:hypothetical protein
MIFNPVYILSTMIVKFFIRKVSKTFLFSIITLCITLLKNVGFFTTLKIIKKLFLFISINSIKQINIENFKKFLFQYSLDPLASTLIIEWAVNHLDELYSLDLTTMSKLRKFLKFLIYFLVSIPFSNKIIKYILIIIFSALGITWNTFLSSFTTLKYLSEILLDFIGIKSPNITNIKKITSQINISEELDNNNINKISYLYFLSLMLGGVLIIGGCLVFTDWLAPDWVRSLPYTSNILDGFYNGCNSCWNFITSLNPFKTDDLTPKSSPKDLPSPTSSTSSDVTVKQTPLSPLFPMSPFSPNIEINPNDFPTNFPNPFSE